MERLCCLALGGACIADSAVSGEVHAMMACDDSTNPLELDHNSSKNGSKNKKIDHNNQPQPATEQRCVGCWEGLASMTPLSPVRHMQ
mmetsp:Transcript_29058/g.54965  ORF Transcript_29058/g.54965 Transcript_29058/m.54965 type:complete len:87 (-) Transcript_29058:28-288(-)